MSKERLKAIRLELGLTQTEFGKYVGGASMRAVQSWELGDRRIPSIVDALLKLKGHDIH